MKGNVIIALVVGAILGFVVGRATRSAGPESAPTAQIQPPAPSAAPAKPAERPRGGGEDPNAVYKFPVGDSPSMGAPTAKVTIIEVTDFQCPFCKRANDTMKQLVQKYGKDLRLVVKQNPLSFHQHAHAAAQAALAANEQGKYFEMHHKLFENNQALDRANLEKYAQEIGLDVNRFKQALDTQKFKDKIDAEQKAAVALGAGGTPSFFINGRKVVGAQPMERFTQVVDEELKKADALLARGVKPQDLYEETIKNGATSPVMVAEAPGAQPSPQQPAPTPAVQKIEVPAYSPFKGPKAAKVTIVEWSDFQCPFCKRGADAMEQVTKAYPKDVKFVFRHQPLSFHPNAMPAAKAAMAAGRQGKFFEMHDKMFAEQAALSPEKYEAWAKELKLDLAKFKKDLEDPELASQINKDSSDGMKVGANGTPTFFINGRKVEGAMPFETFKGMIDEEIKRADELMKQGVKLEQVYDKITSMAPPEPPKVVLEVGTSPVKGDKNAPVKIFEFSEFQCPFCSRVLPTVKQIEETYKGKVAIIFKNKPLPFHNNAQLAAEAGLAAHEQGKFWQMHDEMFANQGALERASLEGYAKKIGLDLNKFKAALDSGKFKDAVQKDLAAAETAGVQGTPSFVINGRLVVGAQPFEEFKKVIDEELSKQAAK